MMVAMTVAPAAEAVIVTACDTADAAAIAVNCAEIAPTGTVIEAGIERVDAVLEIDTGRPAVGAGTVNVTVQVDDSPALIVVGLQESALMAAGATILIEAPVPLATSDAPVADDTTTPVICTITDRDGAAAV